MKALEAVVFATLAVGCTNVATGPGPEPEPEPEPEPQQHDARFVGLWAVEQPLHALYEVTYYDFGADGTLHTMGSEPADCSGHLSEHCVTGSVENCAPATGTGTTSCESTLSCVFGDRWFSRSSARLVIAGECSDDIDRLIELELAADASGNAGWGGAGGTLITVGGDAGWSHNTWEWTFRKCPAGTTTTDCYPL